MLRKGMCNLYTTKARAVEIAAWVGMWKNSDEWGPVYSGLMTDCNEVVRPVHNRMPVLLHEEDYDLWLRGTLDDVMSFQGRCFPDELVGNYILYLAR